MRKLTKTEISIAAETLAGLRDDAKGEFEDLPINSSERQGHYDNYIMYAAAVEALVAAQNLNILVEVLEPDDVPEGEG